MSRWAWIAGPAAAILLVQYVLFIDPDPDKPSAGTMLFTLIISVALFTSILAGVYRFVLPRPPVGRASHVFLMVFWAVVVTFTMAGPIGLCDRIVRIVGGHSAGRVDTALPQAADHGITSSALRDGSPSR